MEKKENDGMKKLLGAGIACIFVYWGTYFLFGVDEPVIDRLVIGLSICIALYIAYEAYSASKLKEKKLQENKKIDEVEDNGK